MRSEYIIFVGSQNEREKFRHECRLKVNIEIDIIKNMPEGRG
jgi:hypothetical protein